MVELLKHILFIIFPLNPQFQAAKHNLTEKALIFSSGFCLIFMSVFYQSCWSEKEIFEFHKVLKVFILS